MRKLASIRQVKSVNPIPGADKIEVLTIDGWQCVAVKGVFKPNDLCVYFEIDSFLPIEERFEFLRKNCYKKIKETNEEGFRIKTLKLKGQLSQGLAIPFEGFPECSDKVINDDVTDILKIRKFEQPIPASLSGNIKGLFPEYCPKTDEERIQNVYNDLKVKYENSDDIFEISVKLDGTSFTSLIDPHSNEFLVCSRNLSLYDSEDNTYWHVAKNRNIESAIKLANSHFNTYFAFQAEIIGPGIQKNKESLGRHDCYVFNIYDFNKNHYLNYTDRMNVMSHLSNNGFVINHVPVIGHISGRDLFSKSLDDILIMAEGHSLNSKIREGLVFKSKNDSFKAISNVYLLKLEE